MKKKINKYIKKNSKHTISWLIYFLMSLRITIGLSKQTTDIEMISVHAASRRRWRSKRRKKMKNVNSIHTVNQISCSII